MKKKREISVEYIEDFIKAIQNGGPVTCVPTQGYLAVDHPARGTMVVQLKDKIVDKEDKKEPNEPTE